MYLSVPNIYADTTPYKITLPVNLNALHPIPVTKPSFLYSIMLLVIACAKPVIGIINPALALETKLSKNPNAVSKQEININDTIIKEDATLSSKL